jgi:hypothetical protein
MARVQALAALAVWVPATAFLVLDSLALDSPVVVSQERAVDLVVMAPESVAKALELAELAALAQASVVRAPALATALAWAMD